MAKLLSVEMNQPMEINDRTRIREKPPPPNRKLGKRTGRVRNQTSRLQTRWSDPAAAQRLSSTSFSRSPEKSPYVFSARAFFSDRRNATQSDIYANVWRIVCRIRPNSLGSRLTC